MASYRDVIGHLVSDSLDELHAIARDLRLLRVHFRQPPRHKYPHYLLYAVSIRRRADEMGVLLVPPAVLEEKAKVLLHELEGKPTT